MTSNLDASYQHSLTCGIDKSANKTNATGLTRGDTATFTCTAAVTQIDARARNFSLTGTMTVTDVSSSNITGATGQTR